MRKREAILSDFGKKRRYSPIIWGKLEIYVPSALAQPAGADLFPVRLLCFRFFPRFRWSLRFRRGRLLVHPAGAFAFLWEWFPVHPLGVFAFLWERFPVHPPGAFAFLWERFPRSSSRGRPRWGVLKKNPALPSGKTGFFLPIYYIQAPAAFCGLLQPGKKGADSLKRLRDVLH